MESKETHESNRKKSREVCFLLDNLGYGDDIRKFRETTMSETASKLSDKVVGFGQFVATGSKTEGSCLILQSDFDLMVVTNDILCVENSYGTTNFNILKPYYSENVPPGYVRVAATHLDHTSMVGTLCSVSFLYSTDCGELYVSSTVFKNFLKQARFSMENHEGVIVHEFSSSGPANTKTTQLTFFQSDNSIISSNIGSTDIVYSIYFYSSIYLGRWESRLRHHGWPSFDLIQTVSSMEGYIVPVGSIDGETPDLEWRVSYVTAENKLISSLRSVQFKLYVIMKMIAKELIYKDFPVISSYVVRNVVFWVCELNSQSIFVPELHLGQIAKCLLFIRTCIENNHLPNYTIPERNLIACRLNLQSKRQLIVRLTTLLNEGKGIFRRLSFFTKYSQFCEVSDNNSVYSFGQKRDELEKLFWKLTMFLCDKLHPSQLFSRTFSTDIWHFAKSDERIKEHRSRMQDIILPEWRDLVRSGNTQRCNEICTERLKQYLS